MGFLTVLNIIFFHQCSTWVFTHCFYSLFLPVRPASFLTGLKVIIFTSASREFSNSASDILSTSTPLEFSNCAIGQFFFLSAPSEFSCWHWWRIPKRSPFLSLILLPYISRDLSFLVWYTAQHSRWLTLNVEFSRHWSSIVVALSRRWKIVACPALLE